MQFALQQPTSLASIILRANSFPSKVILFLEARHHIQLTKEEQKLSKHFLLKAISYVAVDEMVENGKGLLCTVEPTSLMIVALRFQTLLVAFHRLKFQQSICLATKLKGHNQITVAVLSAEKST